MGLLDLNTYAPAAETMTPEQREQTSDMGWLNMAAAFANMGNVGPNQVGYSPMQMITGGVQAFGQGANQYAKMLAEQYEQDRQKKYKEQTDAYLENMTPDQRQALGVPDSVPLTPQTLQDTLRSYYKQQGPAAKGGATGALVDRAMQDPDFRKQLYDIQTGWRQGTQTDGNGIVMPIDGAAEAKGDIKYGEEAGKQRAQRDYAASKEEEKKVGQEQGEAKALLSSMEAKMPELEQTVSDLNALGKEATYTWTGQAADWAVRQSGLGATDGAVARAEYVSMVDNQILPLLRDTFGAQFTENEGKSLRKTLGDADASPEEKEAVLKSFIEQKKKTIRSLARQTGQPFSENERGGEDPLGIR